MRVSWFLDPFSRPLLLQQDGIAYMFLHSLYSTATYPMMSSYQYAHKKGVKSRERSSRVSDRNHSDYQATVHLISVYDRAKSCHVSVLFLLFPKRQSTMRYGPPKYAIVSYRGVDSLKRVYSLQASLCWKRLTHVATDDCAVSVVCLSFLIAVIYSSSYCFNRQSCRLLTLPLFKVL
jgi:hypothetical protein